MSTDGRHSRAPDTGRQRAYGYGVSEDEVNEVLRGPGEDVPAANHSRIKVGRTSAGRYLRVIYLPDADGASVLAFNAYDLKDKEKADRRRGRGRPR